MSKSQISLPNSEFDELDEYDKRIVDQSLMQQSVIEKHDSSIRSQRDKRQPTWMQNYMVTDISILRISHSLLYFQIVIQLFLMKPPRKRNG